jgi:crossover junction endodeoxyribonuclease RuvC
MRADLDAEVVVLGVDPGLRITGYGALRCSPNYTEVIDFNHIKTDPRAPVEARLQAVHWGIREALLRVEAKELAIELPFVAANVRSAFAIGEARAAALLAAAEEGIPVFQYTPAEVKQSIAGYGRSDKRQMQETVRLQLGLATLPTPADAADALAIALCHYANRRIRALLDAL